MKIAVSNDHGGVNLKAALLKHLEERNIEYVDYGYVSGPTENADYPDYALPAAKAVASGACDLGILICGTGIGMSIAANKVPGIRCGHVHDTFSARMTRMHNDANMIAFGERVIGVGLMVDIVDAYLDAEFLGGRHERRVEKITAIEKEFSK